MILPIVIIPWRVFKWLLLLIVVAPTVVFGGLYLLAVFFEPAPKAMSAPTPGLVIRR